MLSTRWHLYVILVNTLLLNPTRGRPRNWFFWKFSTLVYASGVLFKGDIVRGHENFVVDGQHFAVLKNNFKYTLIPNRVNRVGFIEIEKFSPNHYALHVNFFTDVGYVRDDYYFKDNLLFNSFLMRYGIGIDPVTYYDKVFRTEFSLNRHGNTGIDLHLIAPI